MPGSNGLLPSFDTDGNFSAWVAAGSHAEGDAHSGGSSGGIVYVDTSGNLATDGPTIDASGNVTVYGNIAVSGTVDGRDVAADGTLLDSIGVGGTSGHVLTSNGPGLDATFQAGGGSGDVSKVGTPVDNQIGVWTGDGTIEGDASLTYDGTTLSAGILNATAPTINDTPLSVNGAVGQTAPIAVFNIGSDTVVQVSNNGDVDLDRTGDTAGPSVQLSHWSSKTAKRSTVDFRKSGSNTKGGNTTLSDGTQMGDIFWWGNDGNGFHESARIYGLSAGTTNNNTPGKIRFATTPSGAYTAADRMEIDESGLVSVYDDLAITSPTVPASASATGTAGTVSWDADYIYICAATDTWKRVAISTW
jgi:hypothetical protein